MKKTTIKKNTALRVGVAGATNLSRRWPEVKRGSLSCRKCGATGLHAVHQGDICGKCWVPEKIDLSDIPSPANYNYEREQMPETDALHRQVRELLAANNLKRNQLARMLGIEYGRFRLWLKGATGIVAQHNCNAIVKAGMAKNFGEVAA